MKLQLLFDTSKTDKVLSIDSLNFEKEFDSIPFKEKGKRDTENLEYTRVILVNNHIDSRQYYDKIYLHKEHGVECYFPYDGDLTIMIIDSDSCAINSDNLDEVPRFFSVNIIKDSVEKFYIDKFDAFFTSKNFKDKYFKGVRILIGFSQKAVKEKSNNYLKSMSEGYLSAFKKSALKNFHKNYSELTDSLILEAGKNVGFAPLFGYMIWPPKPIEFIPPPIHHTHRKK